MKAHRNSTVLIVAVSSVICFVLATVSFLLLDEPDLETPRTIMDQGTPSRETDLVIDMGAFLDTDAGLDAIDLTSELEAEDSNIVDELIPEDQLSTSGTVMNIGPFFDADDLSSSYESEAEPINLGPFFDADDLSPSEGNDTTVDIGRPMDPEDT